MDQNVKQCHFSLYLQNRPLKYCLEVDIPPSPQKIALGIGVQKGKFPKELKG